MHLIILMFSSNTIQIHQKGVIKALTLPCSLAYTWQANKAVII